MLTVYSQGIKVKEDGTYEGIAAFRGERGETGATGATGPAGTDGYSPTATVTKSGSVATITITDKNGTTTANVTDGENPVNADWNATSGLSEILNKPNLATVATSGSYNDLSNKPTIPSTHETWTFTLSDSTTVTKEIMLWQST